MPTQINEVSSALPWSWRIVVIGNTERYISIGQHASKNVVARTNWDDGIQSCIGGAQEEVQEGAEPARVRREVRRQLKENWPDLVAKNR